MVQVNLLERENLVFFANLRLGGPRCKKHAIDLLVVAHTPQGILVTEPVFNQGPSHWRESRPIVLRFSLSLRANVGEGRDFILIVHQLHLVMITYVLEGKPSLGASEALVVSYVHWGCVHCLSRWLLPGNTPIIGVGRCYHV